MQEDKYEEKKMERQHYRLDKKKTIRSVLYGMAAIIITACLVVLLNIIFLGIAMVQYVRLTPDPVGSGEIAQQLILTDQGYDLSTEMKEKMDEGDMWAMLLDEEGQVMWEYRKPAELADSYSRADITRMSKWYLMDYPVHLRVLEDKILVVGWQKNTLWKYNIELSLPWIDFLKQMWLYFLLVNFIWVVGLAFLFTRKWSRKREMVRLEWIGGISHDIRTPLSMVMGYADELEKSENLPEEERQQAAIIKHQGVIMKGLIEDLNLTSGLEYSMQALRKETIRPAAVLREVVTSFLNDAQEGKLQIELEIAQDTENILIKADRRLLMRAFQNLIHNSIQHGGQSDMVKIQIHMWRQNHLCCITFEDNGMGYLPEVLRQFRNRKRKTTQNIRGLGIVQKVILAHGGKICFGNRAEGGGFCRISLKNVRR